MKTIYGVLSRLMSISLASLHLSCETASKPTADDPSSSINDLYKGLEFNMPIVQEPQFPANECSVLEFGGVGDGIVNNGDAFEKAIQAMAEKGGGKVIVPRGIWLTGPIELKSNINLHLEEGSFVVFSKNFDEYPIVKTSFEGLDTYRCLSPISGTGLENIAITGKGIIDGSGDAWRPVKKEKLTDRHWEDLVKSGGVLSDDGRIWYPSEKSKRGDGRDNFNVPNFTDPEKYESVKDFLRPVMVSLVRCKKVLLDGPTFQNSPAWNIHPLMCEDVIVRNTTIRNPWYSQNGDGLDLESCKNALIYNNNFDVGDDAICFKSGKNEDGRKRGMPTENVIVSNNIVYHGHGGFTVGSETSGGMRNVHISNCTFIGTDIGLRFKSTRGRGGVIENIYISNIDMIDIPTEAIRFNLFYEGESPIPDSGDDAGIANESEIFVADVDETTPSFRNIHMKNITVIRSKTAAFFQGLPEMKLQDVSLENAVFESQEGVTIIDADGIEFKNVRLIHKKNAALTIFNSANINMSGFTTNLDTESSLVRILGKETNSIHFAGSNVTLGQVKLSKDVPENVVTFDDTL
jgi:polygalacturonase